MTKEKIRGGIFIQKPGVWREVISGRKEGLIHLKKSLTSVLCCGLGESNEWVCLTRACMSHWLGKEK